MTPILIKPRVFKRRPLIPIGLWLLVMMMFIAGYFTGGVIQSLTFHNNYSNTLKFINNR